MLCLILALQNYICYGDQIKKADLGGLFTMHGGKRNACKISFCVTKQTILDVRAVIGVIQKWITY